MGTRIALSGYFGLIVYCMLSLFLGPMGIQAYSGLETRVELMRENLNELENLHGSAQARLDSARSDSETLALEARSLGYIEEGQVVVRMGFPESDPLPHSLGTLVPYEAPTAVQDASLKAIALVSALCVFFLSLLIRFPLRDRVSYGRRSGSGGTVRSAGAETR